MNQRESYGTDLLASIGINFAIWTMAILSLVTVVSSAYANEEVRTVPAWVVTGKIVDYSGAEILSSNIIHITNIPDEKSCRDILSFWSVVKYPVGMLGNVRNYFTGTCLKVKQFSFEKIDNQY